MCCAPCSGAIIEALCAQGLQPTLFWSNSNIYTAEENAKRLAVLQEYAAKFGLDVVEDSYCHASWLEFLKKDLPGSLADYPERGERCLACFKFRLLRAAKYAKDKGFDCLSTSLAASRWKSLEQVAEAGNWAVERAVDGGSADRAGLDGSEQAAEGEQAGLVFWAQNWRKGGLQPRRNEIIAEQNFYNQSFCGCEFSLNHE